MTDIIFLGLTKTQWDLINSFSNWASALGSLAAAWVALHLAMQAAKPRAKAWVGRRIIIGDGIEKPYPEYVSFSIVNTGDRVFRIAHIEWQLGFLLKRYAIQLHDTSLSSPLPIELSHGQEASWRFNMSYNGEKWQDSFVNGFLKPESRNFLATIEACFYFQSLRAVFTTSTGHRFYVKPEAELIRIIKSSKNLK